MENVEDPQELSFSSPSRSYSPPAQFIRTGIRYPEFREILNTAVQATQHDRPLQRQTEALGMDLCSTFFKSFYFFFDVIKTTINYSHAISDAEDIFADTNSIDAVPSRPNVRRGARYLSAIQISDDEMDAVCIFRASRGFMFGNIKIPILFQNFFI